MVNKSISSGSSATIEIFNSLFKRHDLKIFGGNFEIDDSTPLYNIEINVEQFPRRFQHVLKFFDIHNLGSVLNLNYNELLLLPNLNSRTLGEVYLVIDKIVKEFSVNKIPVNSITPESTETQNPVHLDYGKGKKSRKTKSRYHTFIEALEAELEKQPAKLHEMLCTSFINGWNYHEIAKNYAVTNERARQKIRDVIRPLAASLLPYKGSLEQDLLKYILENPKLIGFEFFANRKFDALFLTRLVARLYPDLPIEDNRINLKNKVLFLRHESIIKAISSILKSNKLVKTDEFLNQLYSLFPDKFMQSITVLFSWDRVVVTAGESGSFISMSIKYLEDLLLQTLSSSDQPLTIDQICEKTKSFKFTRLSIKNKLQGSRNFYRIEKDLYGTARHLPVSSNKIQSLINATAVILQKDGRAVNVSNLLIDLKDSFPQLKTKYLLYSILKNSDTFVLHGGMSFSLRSDIYRKKDLKDIVMNLFISRGVPLHISEIIVEIKKERDFNEASLSNSLKSFPGVEHCFSDYYGLSSLSTTNLDFLSGCEFYIKEIMEEELCPHTTEADIRTFFKDYNLKKVFATLHGSDNFILLENAENGIPFFVNKKWRYVSIVKTILFNQKNGTLSDTLLTNYLNKVDSSFIKKNSKYSKNNISHLRGAKKFVLLTPDILDKKESLVEEYIHFLSKSGNINSFDQVTSFLNNKLKLSLTVFQTEAIYNIWIKTKSKQKLKF